MKQLFLTLLMACVFAPAVMAQMTDSQVKEYTRQEIEKGTPQDKIILSLTQKGVTRNQLVRVKKQVEDEAGKVEATKKTNTTMGRNRIIDVAQEEDTHPEDLEKDSTLVAEEETADRPYKIFGQNVFNNKKLTFNPSMNIPTPADYRLGPGDEVIIDVWGASETTIRQVISPDGKINVELLGPVYLSGMTVEEANEFLRKKLSSIYAGIEGEEGASDIQLTLGQIRTIQVNVMGEVLTPGTYSLSSLASVFHALYMAGGINDIGSLRKVQLFRNNSLFATVDVYNYLLNGQMQGDVRLFDGDVIVVPPYVSHVSITGAVKRPLIYEMIGQETMADLLKYAGGFAGGAYTQEVGVTRITGKESQYFTVEENQYPAFALQDRDSVVVGAGLADLFANRVELKGAVYRAGFYEIGEHIKTVGDLIKMAGGIRGDAFLNRAVLGREKEDRSLVVVPIDLRRLLDGQISDIPLHKNDRIYIPSIHDLQEYGDFVVHGEVARPGNYAYADNTTVEDLIVLAGGLLESASTARVDIARRIVDPKSESESLILTENYSLQVKDGLVVDGQEDFVLKPYDEIYIRTSPGYRPQRNVTISGEVLFSGNYALSKKNERLSDLVVRAGGVTPHAYVQGARLIRRLNPEEEAMNKDLLRLLQFNSGGKDTLDINALNLEPTYNVGIELDKALDNPGTYYDVVLREGDQVVIPEQNNSVKIDGAVMYPNVVAFKAGANLSYYINQAGGFNDRAKKSRVFVIYMNGTVSRISGGDRHAIQPGCKIVVPIKAQGNRLSLSEIMAITSSTTSLATVVAMLMNVLK